MLVNVYDKKAKEIGNMELSDEVFAKEYNEAIIHQCVVAQMNNMRQGRLHRSDWWRIFNGYFKGNRYHHHKPRVCRCSFS